MPAIYLASIVCYLPVTNLIIATVMFPFLVFMMKTQVTSVKNRALVYRFIYTDLFFRLLLI